MDATQLAIEYRNSRPQLAERFNKIIELLTLHKLEQTYTNFPEHDKPAAKPTTLTHRFNN